MPGEDGEVSENLSLGGEVKTPEFLSEQDISTFAGYQLAFLEDSRNLPYTDGEGIDMEVARAEIEALTADKELLQKLLNSRKLKPGVQKSKPAGNIAQIIIKEHVSGKGGEIAKILKARKAAAQARKAEADAKKAASDRGQPQPDGRIPNAGIPERNPELRPDEEAAKPVADDSGQPDAAAEPQPEKLPTEASGTEPPAIEHEPQKSRITLDRNAEQIDQLKQELVAARDNYARLEAEAHPKWERLQRFFKKVLKKESPDTNEAKDKYRAALKNYKDYFLEIHKDDNDQVVNLYREMAEEHILLFGSITEKRTDQLETREKEQPAWKKKLKEYLPRVTKWLQDKKEDQRKWSQAILEPEFLEGKQAGMLSILGKRYAQSIAGYVDTYFGPREAAEAQKRREGIEKDVKDFSYALAGGQIGKVEIGDAPDQKMPEMDRRMLQVDQKEIAREKEINVKLDDKIAEVDSRVAKMAKTDRWREAGKNAAQSVISAVARPAIGAVEAVERRMAVKREIKPGAKVAQIVRDMIDKAERFKDLEKHLEKYGYSEEKGNMQECKEKLLDELLVNFAIAHKGITHVLEKAGQDSAGKDIWEKNPKKPIIEEGDTLYMKEVKNGLRLVLKKKDIDVPYGALV